MRDESKYEHVIEFALALPKIRARVRQDLGGHGLLRERVLATIVALLEDTLIRVGNAEYARDNKSFGLTTLQNKHLAVQGSTFSFSFRGKSGIHHDISIRNRRLAPILKKLRDLPGQDLFQYIGEDGERHDVTSDLVNEYISQAAEKPFTAKDFRTWAGTVSCALALGEAERASSMTDAKRRVAQAVKDVAKRLGNTPSVCRKCYVHPAIIERYLEKSEFDVLRQRASSATADAETGLRAEEEAVLAFLREQLADRIGA